MTPSDHGLPFFTIPDDEEKVLRATMTPSERYLPFYSRTNALNSTEPHTLMTPSERYLPIFTLSDDEEKVFVLL